MHSCIVQACCIYCYTITSIAQGKRKAAADPLNDMMMYVKAKKKSAKDTGTQPPVSDGVVNITLIFALFYLLLSAPLSIYF